MFARTKLRMLMEIRKILVAAIETLTRFISKIIDFTSRKVRLLRMRKEKLRKEEKKFTTLTMSRIFSSEFPKRTLRLWVSYSQNLLTL